MGAGCHYTLTEDRDELAYWLDIGFPETEDGEPDLEDEGFYYSFMLDQLGQCILDHPMVAKYGYMETYNGKGEYVRDHNRLYYGENYIVVLESNYNGDGIVINFEYQCEEYLTTGLQRYNYAKSYAKLLRHINKNFPLWYATSGYTSAEVAVGEMK